MVIHRIGLIVAVLCLGGAVTAYGAGVFSLAAAVILGATILGLCVLVVVHRARTCKQ